ncbi:peptide-methionine (S)-S-oxide reductase MsrA [Erysipelotrichaceae bacterium RD49]|nr:peptide-methionine (S)-S-oxide reductase MsrA [Erysipelotrichaceae bacterium RD49]
MKTIILAGGCFWGLQKFFDQFECLKTETGYANGNGDQVSYQQVCAGSGHAEAVKIEYPDSIELDQILAAYFAAVDPTSLNKQGNDVGINYRTGIYVTNEQDTRIAQAMLADLQKHFTKPIQIEVKKLVNYCSAEDDHQKYLDKNPGGYCHLPRVLLSGHILPSQADVLETYPSLKEILSE